MTINQTIMSALSGIAPTTPDIKDKDTTGDYITFNYVAERDDFYCDDEPNIENVSLQVHYFTEGNPTNNKKAIRRALRSSGFTINGTYQTYENDTKLYHVAIEISIAQQIDD